jgi:integrase
MAYVIERRGSRGRIRYTAMYKSATGAYKSAGTYDDREQAVKIAQGTEAHAAGLLTTTSPAEKANMTIDAFIEQRFLREHQMEPNTRMTYARDLRNYVIPLIGSKRVWEVDREMAYRLLTKVIPETFEVTISTIDHIRTALSSMFSMAESNGYVERGSHPVKGIVLKGTSARKLIKVYTLAQYERVHDGLFNEEAQLFSFLISDTGVRFCEAISFVEGDLDYATRFLSITKSTIEVTAEFHPQGGRFVTRNYTKNGEHRGFVISKTLATRVRAHVKKHNIKPGELWFPVRMFTRPKHPIASDLSQAELNALGWFTRDIVNPRTGAVSTRRYRHGTLTGYATGKCRCAGCRQASRAYNRTRMRDRRNSGSGEWTPRRRQKDGSEYLSRTHWRNVWKRAVEATGLPYIPPYDVRHCHASWLIDQGVDLAKVQARLGHNDLKSTTHYVTVVDQMSTETADLLDAIRSPQKQKKHRKRKQRKKAA